MLFADYYCTVPALAAWLCALWDGWLHKRFSFGQICGRAVALKIGLGWDSGPYEGMTRCAYGLKRSEAVITGL